MATEELVQTNMCQQDACNSCKYTKNCDESPEGDCMATNGQHYSKEFVLPLNWCCEITKESKDILNNWRKNIIRYDDYDCPYPYIYQNGSGGYNDSFEITFEQFKKYVLKESIETPKEVVPEYVELLEGFDNTCTGKIFDTNQPIPQINGWSNQWTWESIFKNNIQRPYFKPSTKEAFDAQNQPKSIEKWSVGSYVVFLNSEIQSNGFNKGDIQQICEYNSLSITYHSGAGNTVGDKGISEQIKWFATKSEAEEFAKTLVEPVKKGIKQPLKQAVHCKTQEEWDFVTEKLGNDGENWFIHPDWGNNKSFCISFEGKNQSQTLQFYKDSGYQILSFQEWCDLNGYKMEKEVKFKVGKWYKNLGIQPHEKTFGKFLDLKNNNKQFWMSECIYKGNEVKIQQQWLDYSDKTIECPLEEIQQYLPDNYPDKIKSNQEFKVGDYIFVMIKGKNFGDILKVRDSFIEKKSNYSGVWINHTPSSFGGGGFRLNGNGYIYGKDVRHATPEEINQHLISIGQITAGEPLNIGIEPNKDGMFKYTTYSGTTYAGKCSTVSGPLKMILSIDDEELPMVSIIKTNSIKQLLNLE